MKKKNFATWAAAATLVVGSLTACGLDMPKETNSSFETMIVKKSDIELPYKFSAKMKGQNDVTVTPQVPVTALHSLLLLSLALTHTALGLQTVVDTWSVGDDD